MRGQTVADGDGGLLYELRSDERHRETPMIPARSFSAAPFRLATIVCGLVVAALSLSPAWAAQAGRGGDFAVGMRRLELVDPSRAAWTGSGPRPVAVTIWYPTRSTAPAEPITIGPAGSPQFVAGRAVVGAPPIADGPRRPLIVMSHGTGGAALQLMWLGQALARHGYIVAAIDHHGNTAAEPAYAPQGFVLWWERARDVTFTITSLLNSSEWKGRIDASHIGFAGYSLGGATGVLLVGGRADMPAFLKFCAGPKADGTCRPQTEFPGAFDKFEAMAAKDPKLRAAEGEYNQSFRDPRISAAFLIAPAIGQAFTTDSLKKVAVPVDIVVGDADPIAQPATNAQAYAAALPHASLTILPGGVTHYTFLSPCGPAGFETLAVLCRDAPGIDRAAIHDQVAERAARFFRRVWGGG
jgi:predicted dienelactone hydrolase